PSLAVMSTSSSAGSMAIAATTAAGLSPPTPTARVTCSPTRSSQAGRAGSGRPAAPSSTRPATSTWLSATRKAPASITATRSSSWRHREGGIWAPGGAVVDPAGNLYVAVGNAEGSGFNYGNSVIKLAPDLRELDYWAPSNWAALNAGDVDVGSVAPALLQDGLLFQAGKAGI